MKKSNIIIMLILVIASIFFLWLWYFLGLNFVDHPRDLVLSIIWWLVVIIACVGIHFAEKLRQKNIRTSFLAPGLIYNAEAGIVKVDAKTDVVPELQRILSNLKYDMVKAKIPEDSRIRFDYVVRTNRFAQNGNVWEGELVKISHSNRPKPFRDREELVMLLEGTVVPA